MSAISIGNSGGIERGVRLKPVTRVSVIAGNAGGSGFSANLTRRGRLTVSALAGFALAILMGGWLSATVLGASPAEAELDGIQAVRVNGSDAAVLMSRSAPALIEHVVTPGETVWSMATSVSGDDDPRVYVDRIRRLNGMESGSVHVGDVVLLPNGG